MATRMTGNRTIRRGRCARALYLFGGGRLGRRPPPRDTCLCPVRADRGPGHRLDGSRPSRRHRHRRQRGHRGFPEFHVPTRPATTACRRCWPGTYTIRAELSGFQTVETTGVILTIQQTIILNQELALAQVEETVTVTGTAPLLDTRRSDISTSVSDLQIQDLPVASRRWVDLALLTPGHQSGRDPRLLTTAATSTWVPAAATTRTPSSWMGVNNTWAEMGEARQNFPMDAIGEFQVTTSNFKAELRARDRRAHDRGDEDGNERLRRERLLVLPRQVADRTHSPAEGIPEERSELRKAGVPTAPVRRPPSGGPIAEDRTHFFFAYERTNEELFYDIDTRGVFPEYDGTFPKDEWRYMWLARINHQLSEDHQVWLRVAWENEYRPNLTAGGSRIHGFDFAVPRNAEVFGVTSVTGANLVERVPLPAGFLQVRSQPGLEPWVLRPGRFQRRAACPLRAEHPAAQPQPGFL